MTNFNEQAVSEASPIKMILVKSLVVFIGLLATGIGTSIMFQVGMGSAPPGTIIEGVKEFFNVSYGIAGIIVNFSFLVLLFFTERSLIGLGTIAMLFFGYFVDLGNIIIAPLAIGNLSGAMQILAMVLGCLVVAVGTGLYLGVNFGSGAIDGLSILFDRKLPLDLKYCRWITDALLVLVGALMGASWGLGTVVAVAITGPILQSIITKMSKYF